MKIKFINYFMNIAETTASLSTSKRLKVGAIIVNNDRQIVSCGYNGTISGMNNCCEDENGETHANVIHAEVNALMKVVNSSVFVDKNSKMFITHAPCINCSRLILITGIKELYYKHDYRLSDGIELLRTYGVKIFKIGE